MTQFVDLRRWSHGGWLVHDLDEMHYWEGVADNPKHPQSIDRNTLLKNSAGRDVVFVIHGFNVNRTSGIEHIDHWASLLRSQLPGSANAQVIGVLWPGDSVWAFGLDYPEEPKVAQEAGALLARWVNAYLPSVASVSLVSHSLGARVVLSCIESLQSSVKVRRAVLMAGAIDNDCLAAEFSGVVSRVEQISVLSSLKDSVLSLAFPLGNPVSGLVGTGHPWYQSALGHTGPSLNSIACVKSPYAIQDSWEFGHKHYLQYTPSGTLRAPVPAPPGALRLPALPPATVWATAPAPNGWQETFTATFVADRLA